MRFLIQFLFITITASVFELFLPWWSIAIAAALGGYLLSTSANFFAGFLAISTLWLITTLTIHFSSGAPLAERVAAIFFSMPVPALFAVTCLIGGLIGGFAAMAGGALRKDRRRLKYY
jgi:hypothetical protein